MMDGILKWVRLNALNVVQDVNHVIKLSVLIVILNSTLFQKLMSKTVKQILHTYIQ